MYLQVSSQLRPKSRSQLQPTIRHPDLQPHNLFVSDDFRIVGLIDWQHCSVLPLYLQAGVPKYWQNTSDEPVVVEKPELPPDYEQLSEAEQSRAMLEYQQRQLYLLYLGYTTRFNPSHMDAYLIKGLSFKRRIFEHASAPWEGDNTTLKADLILAAQNWEALTGSDDAKQAPVCPISFQEQDIEECLRVDLLLKEADSQMEAVRESIGIGVDGWVPSEQYEAAADKNKFIRQQVIDCAENDVERQLSLKHYPFDDHNEEE
ncbi:hypothetical protein DV736_g5622, partial [Chaetothyriales sp. CBS 134916]